MTSEVSEWYEWQVTGWNHRQFTLVSRVLGEHMARCLPCALGLERLTTHTMQRKGYGRIDARAHAGGT